MSATYKPISFEDIEIAVELMRAFYAIDGYPIDIEKSKTLFEHFIVNESLGRAWLIESDGKPVGYMILTFIFSFEYGGTIAFVDELYLIESSRGKGLGKSSVEFIKNEMKNLDLKLLYLEVEPHNTNAKKLYLNSSFSQHNRQLLVFHPINNNNK